MSNIIHLSMQTHREPQLKRGSGPDSLPAINPSWRIIIGPLTGSHQRSWSCVWRLAMPVKRLVYLLRIRDALQCRLTFMSGNTVLKLADVGYANSQCSNGQHNGSGDRSAAAGARQPPQRVGNASHQLRKARSLLPDFIQPMAYLFLISVVQRS